MLGFINFSLYLCLETIIQIKMSNKVITSMIKCSDNRNSNKGISDIEKKAMELIQGFQNNKLVFSDMLLVLENAKLNETGQMLAILEKATKRVDLLIKLSNLEEKYS